MVIIFFWYKYNEFNNIYIGTSYGIPMLTCDII